MESLFKFIDSLECNLPIYESIRNGLSVIFENENIIYANEYISPKMRELTDDEIDVRNTAISIKKSTSPDINKAAADMAKHVDKDNILVPIPSSKGDISANMALANAISSITGAVVVDALSILKERQSNLELGKANRKRLGAREMGLILSQPVMANRVLFIDNVSASGASIQAAINLINGGKGLVYAKDLNFKA
jgi:hypothetical protein